MNYNSVLQKKKTKNQFFLYGMTFLWFLTAHIILINF